MTRPTVEDLRSALQGVTPGEYKTCELLPVYAAWAEREGKEVPSAKTLGEQINWTLCLDRKRARGGVALWIVTQAGLDCRNWFVRPEES